MALEKFKSPIIIGILAFLAILIYTNGSLPEQEYGLLLLSSVGISMLIKILIEKNRVFNIFLERYKIILSIIIIALIFFILKGTSPTFAITDTFSKIIGFRSVGGAVGGLAAIFAVLDPAIALIIIIGGLLILGIPALIISGSIATSIARNSTLIAIILALVIGGYVITRLLRR